jgi:hypothetical protein
MQSAFFSIIIFYSYAISNKACFRTRSYVMNYSGSEEGLEIGKESYGFIKGHSIS